MSDLVRILILGATGNFGARIAQRLASEPGVELVLSSRSSSTAERLMSTMQHSSPNCSMNAAALDQASPDFEQALGAIGPDIVIHTAGPYQGQDYRVAEACIRLGCHYIDLADGRDFVVGFDALDSAAQDRDVLLVTGASTLPGLSSVVVESFRQEFERLEAIEISIAPAHQTPRGTGTVAAVLSYCGRPFKVLTDGSWNTLHGWQSLRRQYYPNLGKRLSGACDVPDLSLFPQRLKGLRTVTFHAALEAPWEQLALWSMAALVRLRVVTNWQRCVPGFRWMSERLIRLGSDSGGMHVQLSGNAHDGSNKTIAWYLTARKNHGPEIPCIPAVILARKLVRNQLSLRGAMPCYNMLTLADFEAEAGNLEISWEVVRAGQP